MRHWALFILLISLANTSFSQTTQAANALSPDGATKYLQLLTGKFNKLQTSIEKQGTKALQNLQKQEAKLYKRLAKKDSAAAKKLFEGQQAKYAAMQAQLQDTGSHKQLKEYLPHFDTLKTSLAFLEKSMANNPQLQAAKQQLQQFEGKMQLANEIKKQLKERKQQLTQQLQQYGMGKQLMGLQKEVYYYQQQLNEYKELLTNTKRLEQKAIAVLKESSLFKNFMRKNSMLAQLFRLPDNYGTPQSLAGLQTVASVQQQLSQRIAAGGAGARQQLQQNLQQAQSQLNQLKNKINSLGNGSPLGAGGDMPNFTPNKQKTKTFLQRLEYGLNFQTQKTQYFMPVTTDVALTAGYKLNDKSIIGIGASYKLGWGTNINNIKISHQGVGLRSYIDIKFPSLGGARGSSTKSNGLGLWITGGYEQNYMQEFTRYEQLNNINAWQQSGLIGLTKKYKLGKKTQNLQLLWDFLSYQQVPRSPALKFRVGYVF